MSEKKYLDKVNPDRREFLEKMTKGAFVIPAVISVMMLNQKLNLTTANAQSNLGICLSSETLIETPQGNVPIVDLKPGMLVFTKDINGNKVTEPVELVSKVLVPGNHVICHLILNDGRELFVSGGHPTVDANKIEDLLPGDILDDAELLSIERVRYLTGYTYDLLPAGETGYYWANGVLLGSTLSPGSNSYIRRAVQQEVQPNYG